MTEYVAFLRGINVGGHRVKMDQLRSIFRDMGMQDVSTFIASGNVAFTTSLEDRSDVQRRLERGLGAALGYEVATMLRLPHELA